MKRYGMMALTATLIGSLAPAALAVPNPGADWILVDSQKVRYFLPGSTSPANATLADAATATSLKSGSNFSSNDWSLVGTENVRYFVPDTGTAGTDLLSSTYVSQRTESADYYVGRSDKIFGATVTDSPTLEPESKWTRQGSTLIIPRYVCIHKPWVKNDLYGTKTREIVTNLKTYRKDSDVVSTSGVSLIDTRTFSLNVETPGSWQYSGAQDSKKQQYASGVDDSTLATSSSIITAYAGQGVTMQNVVPVSSQVTTSGMSANNSSRVTVRNNAKESARSITKSTSHGHGSSQQDSAQLVNELTTNAEAAATVAQDVTSNAAAIEAALTSKSAADKAQATDFVAQLCVEAQKAYDSAVKTKKKSGLSSKAKESAQKAEDEAKEALDKALGWSKKFKN